jgi:membrane protein
MLRNELDVCQHHASWNRATALAMLGARRKASHASDAVRRHPWRAVLVAAGAAMVLALLSPGDSVGQDHTNARK